MWPSRDDLASHGSDPSEKLPDPDEEAAVQERIERVQEEKRLALAEPGLTWKEWFFFDAAKWWVGLLVFIVDIWVFAYWWGVGDIVALGASLAAAVYLEFLLFRFLWYRPEAAHGKHRGGLKTRWLRPVRYGRWTPEAAGAGNRPVSANSGPDPKEFV